MKIFAYFILSISGWQLFSQWSIFWISKLLLLINQSLLSSIHLQKIDITLINNYHHVSLPVFLKFFKKIWQNLLIIYWKQDLYKAQVGLQKQHSTEHAITRLVIASSKYFDNDSYTLYVSFDPRKVTDKVSINNMLLIYLFHNQIINNNLEPLWNVAWHSETTMFTKMLKKMNMWTNLVEQWQYLLHILLKIILVKHFH